MPAVTKSFWNESVSLTLQLLRKRFWVVMLLLLVDIALVFPVEDFAGRMGAEQETLRLLLHFWLAIWSLSEGLILFFAFSYALPELRPLAPPALMPRPFAEPYMKSFAAETLRMAAKVLLWTLAFVIPGLYKYVRLTFVPYVALFAKPYRDGQVDALAVSERLTAGRRILPVLLVLFITLALSLAFELGPMANPLLHALPVRALCLLLGVFNSTWSFAALYLLFETGMKEHDWTP